MWLFGAANTIADITFIRIFSFAGWLLCLPVWYVVIKKSVAKEQTYQWLPFFTCLYLVTSLPFAISIQWASCLELFLANTTGLLSGFLILRAIRFTDNKLRIAPLPAIAGLAVGVVSMFTYQTSTGCFLIPFLVYYITSDATNKDKVMLTGLAGFLLVYVCYFPLYKLSLWAYHMPHNDRTSIYINPMDKLQFFFSHPLERSFWFNAIIYEASAMGRALYKIMLVGWMVAAFVRFGKDYVKAIKYIVLVFAVFMLSYLPLLIVKENYASNRTMLALDVCVWLVLLEMVLYFIKKKAFLQVGGIVIGCTLVTLAWYNLRYQFLQPVTNEYTSIKEYIQQHYHTGIKTMYVIRPSEDAFAKRYNVHTNMDEYGVPSTFFVWTMEYFPRQVIYEITHDKGPAVQLELKHWENMESFSKSGQTVADSVLMLNLPVILNP
jgi:hypothetical protein